MIADVDSTKCTGCRICVDYCPMDVLRLDTFREEIPSCQAGCPAGVDMRGYIYRLNQGDFAGAIKLLREALPLPAITGHVCFHPCETVCARREVDEAVNINSLERFIADYWLKEQAEPIPRLHVGKVAIVGSGPAGLAAAHDLVKAGYPVTVFESMPALGGMLRFGIPEYRLPRDILEAQINYIRDMGVKFQTGVTVGKDVTIDELKDRGYRAIFMAVGAHKSLKLGIPGDDLESVYPGLDFLGNVNTGEKVKVGKKVAIVGGGNVAIDAARTALRVGAKDVLIVYRRSGQEMPAYKEGVEEAESEGVKISYLTAPVRILGKNGKIEGMECTRMKLGKPDASGRRSQIPVAGSRFVIEADMIIPAIGEAPDLASLADRDKLSVTPAGTLKVDMRTLSTGVPGVFAGGDAVNGPTSVVEAIASGKKAAISIERYLKDVDLQTGREPRIKKVEKPPKEGMEKVIRQATPLLPAEQRNRNFREIKIGFSEEMALAEAQRCMTCGSRAYIAYLESCMTCYNCELGCPYEAVDVNPFRKIMPPLIVHPGDNTRYDMLYTSRAKGATSQK